MSRLLQVIVAVIALLVVSGVPTVAASALTDDACADDCSDAERSEETEGCPDDGPAGCPPFCHTCACFSPYARHEVTARVAFLPSTERIAFADPHLVPPSPTLPGVFHPPRLSA